jgi:hypothetical protein
MRREDKKSMDFKALPHKVDGAFYVCFEIRLKTNE